MSDLTETSLRISFFGARGPRDIGLVWGGDVFIA